MWITLEKFANQWQRCVRILKRIQSLNSVKDTCTCDIVLDFREYKTDLDSRIAAQGAPVDDEALVDSLFGILKAVSPTPVRSGVPKICTVADLHIRIHITTLQWVWRRHCVYARMLIKRKLPTPLCIINLSQDPASTQQDPVTLHSLPISPIPPYPPTYHNIPSN